jgi:hypothetical protein
MSVANTVRTPSGSKPATSSSIRARSRPHVASSTNPSIATKPSCR